MLANRFIAKEVFQENLFKEKTILITGGGSGIGRLIADSFAELGANLVISSRDSEKIQRASDEIQNDWGVEVKPISCDISNPDSVKAMVNNAFSWKTVDILINNAGANTLRPTENLSFVRWKAILDTVLSGTFYVTREVAAKWIKKKSKGNIINIASTTGWTGSPLMAPSGAAKAGIINLGKTLGSEWGKYGIRINDVSPGPVFTKGSFDRLWLNEEVIEMIHKKVPLGKFPRPEDVVGSVIFLASPAAEFLTGASIAVDGGESLKPSFADLITEFRPRKKIESDENLL
ncbi:MAG: SDR family oxidoreductase [Leptospiraceae bacterium]|nr:SDR family oxidoreductase [Leptospiraceae bacterium]MCK6381521.1 SDR family oxidoreductase [Leptospiraceae bacterium]NUM40660.1 SDR family oxidoreductase [Leptospiraceae bacterium]